MSKNFKVGDKVRALQSFTPVDWPQLVMGKIYTVECIPNSVTIRIAEPIDLGTKREGMTLAREFSLDSFELVEKIFTPADRQDILDPIPERIEPKENMGIRLNNGKLRWRNFPMFLMEPVIAVGAFAEKREGNPNGKYETFNFLKGMYVNDCMDSLRRHFKSFESPYESDNDLESQESHLAHIAWNALVALHMLKTRPELDDRYKLPAKSEHVDDGSISEEERYELAKALQDRGR